MFLEKKMWCDGVFNNTAKYFVFFSVRFMIEIIINYLLSKSIFKHRLDCKKWSENIYKSMGCKLPKSFVCKGVAGTGFEIIFELLGFMFVGEGVVAD